MDGEQLKTNEVLGQDSVIEPDRKIVYRRPPLHRRVLANFVDIFIFVAVFAALFLATRAIVSSTNDYQKGLETLDSIRLESGVYRKNKDGTISDIITYLNSNTAYNTEYKKVESAHAIDDFMTYAKNVCEIEIYQEIKSNYDNYRTATSMVYSNDKSEFNGTPLFVKDTDGKIVENPALFAEGTYVPNIYGYYYDKAYKPYIDTNVQGYLSTRIPGFYDTNRFLALLIIFAMILPAYLVAGILVYYVPTLFFRRGRCTLGKALYKIGLVDSKVLSPTFARSTARFAYFYIGELVLSLASFGLPYLISFTMMLLTKNKQGFPDYMLRLTEVDTSTAKIYKSFDEVEIDKINIYKKAVDFKVPNYD